MHARESSVVARGHDNFSQVCCKTSSRHSQLGLVAKLRHPALCWTLSHILQGLTCLLPALRELQDARCGVLIRRRHFKRSTELERLPYKCMNGYTEPHVTNGRQIRGKSIDRSEDPNILLRLALQTLAFSPPHNHPISGLRLAAP